MGDQVRDRPSVPGSERQSGSEAFTYSPVRARTVAGAVEPAFANGRVASLQGCRSASAPTTVAALALTRSMNSHAAYD
jgi:hypothetical protein